ncbi:hypothetical protein [Rhodococcus globerulus]|uniref:hypothetical protein n=1 Tax=Rhodococcus globerulus TaxID=33008 RepID=UPI001C59D7E7|nr:hypothetical protein [Rhodococcus globerulus]QXW04028.1 hypothetical protein KYT97_08415 [Rhodococcus globerulus]
MNAQRNELAADIRAVDGNHDLGAAALADKLAELGWSKPRTVETPDDLDSLPELSVVIDKHDDVSQKRGGRWCGYETADLTGKQLARYKPIRVLFTPGGEG